MPLADRLAEVDLVPGEADIEATFSGNLRQCSSIEQDWYYGFDGKPKGNDIDLISVVLHELGHGLGFSSGVDDDTGALLGSGLIDAFSAHIFDNGTGRAWTAMSNAERAASARNFRHLVWNGENVTRVAPLVLDEGRAAAARDADAGRVPRRARRGELRSVPVGRRGDGRAPGRHPGRRLRGGPRTTTTRSCCSRRACARRCKRPPSPRPEAPPPS